MTKKLPRNIYYLCLVVFVIFTNESAAQTGKVRLIDQTTGQGIPNAQIEWVQGKKIINSDTGGFFQNQFQIGDKLIISAPDFITKEIIVENNTNAIWVIALESNAKQIGAVVITHNRLKEKLRESPVTVESITAQSIKETPASDFYEGLGHLRGVDVTAASMAFRVVNTRGFNSTSPVRSLQLIDGVDNQAPGLNFSLGNFLGSSELDIQTTEIVVGASSAYYGPNAFNGVINMTTKSPWTNKGLSAQIKMGERQLGQVMIRYANTYKNKQGRECFAWKANISYLRAYDWVANNRNPTATYTDSAKNPGGYDAVNRYGDEDITKNVELGQRYSRPGLENYYRDGYWEKDLVNYNTRNLKTNLLLAYKINDKNEIQAQSNFGTGTTVYQGDNRYSLNDILFFQHRLEWIGKKGFVRLYATHENAGNTYDAVLTALLLQNSTKPFIDEVSGSSGWSADYSGAWNKYISKVRGLPGYPKGDPISNPNWLNEYLACMQANQEQLTIWHNEVRAIANRANKPNGVPYSYPTYPRYEVGTNAFDSLKRVLTATRSFSAEGKAIGSRFYDKSAMIHLTGERRFTISSYRIISGFSTRMYRPNSLGTIFLDTGKARIVNVEAGLYSGVERRFWENKIKANITARLDKNQNFNLLFSPAASVIYSKTKKNTLRLSFSSALRNPTLQDQYLHYNVGRAILLGNLHGVSHVCTIEDFNNWRDSRNYDTIHFFTIDKIKPEKVKTFELGYKGILFKGRMTLDAGYYISFYTNFIGYKIVVDPDINTSVNLLNSYQVYRVATNSKDMVSTQGISAGANYFLNKFIMFSGNWSWNKLDRRGSTDPLIPAFNTPKNKFNLGILGMTMNQSIRLFRREISLRDFGFSANYKWVQGYRFEGSPQFTGDVSTYWMLDLQFSKLFTKWNSTLKIGASNVTNNKVYQVYGGPAIGRMAYISLTYEPQQNPNK